MDTVRTYYFVLSRNDLVAKILAFNKDCSSLLKFGNGSETYKELKTFDSFSDIISKEEYDNRFISPIPFYKLFFPRCIDSEKGICKTEYDAIYDSQRDEFVFLDLENAQSSSIYGITDVFPCTKKFFKSFGESCNRLFITEEEPFQGFSAETWKTFLADLEASKIITRVN